MKNYLHTFVTAVLAGLCIGIGGIVFLSVENKVVGSVLFAVGLYAICAHGLSLFTGKVGYLVNEKPKYLLNLAVIWLGNLAGTWLSAVCARATRISGITERATAMADVKTADSLVSLFILGIFCGMLMYIAVEGYKRVKNPLMLVFPVSVFILCGFEHCIADMFYFSLAGWSIKAVIATLVITVGNGVGGVLLPLAEK
ncbi:MAG: formate/nitrite transporter family protein, partial [Clostridia bacterium]|nr:formate/nitrite transporter family protein [Clostridia bacterium]